MKKKISYIFSILFALIFCFGMFGCTPMNSEQIAVEKLCLDIGELEHLSKSYKEKDCIKRVLIYVRCKRYNDYYWESLGGKLENDFEDYVQENYTEKDLSYLQTKNYLVDTATGKNIDFIHLFATMNLQLSGDALGCVGGFGGDICQLVQEIKNLNLSSEEEIQQAIVNRFNGESTFGSEDLLADLDAVNIINLYNEFEGDNKVISNSLLSYYYNLTQQNRINNFHNHIFSDNLNASIEDKCEYIFNQLQNNFGILGLCDKYGIDFDNNELEFKTSIRAFVEYISA